MPIGASLHIGLNAVDPKEYSGWDGQLTACEFDANDMQALAKAQGFTKVTKRLTKRATRNRVLAHGKSSPGTEAPAMVCKRRAANSAMSRAQFMEFAGGLVRLGCRNDRPILVASWSRLTYLAVPIESRISFARSVNPGSSSLGSGEGVRSKCHSSLVLIRPGQAVAARSIGAYS